MLTIVIPTINESKSLPQTISDIRHYTPDSEIIIVDDGSTDSTPVIAQSLGCIVISRPHPMGIVSAFIQAVTIAKGNFIVLMDADGQHPASLLPKMLSLMKTHSLVVASRYIDSGNIPDWSLLRRTISNGAISFTHIFLPSTTPIKDITSGYFMVSHNIALTTHFQYPRSWKVLPELISQHPSLSMTEVGYTFRPRLYGKSKLKRSTIWRYFIHILRIRERFRL